MSSKARFAREFVDAMCRRVQERCIAACASASFAPGALRDFHFHRYVNYHRIASRLSGMDLVTAMRVVEFGGSNGVIAGMLEKRGVVVEIAPDFPEVDVQSLGQYGDGVMDMVILDQVLEHVPRPHDAVSEVYRILKPGGHCICTTPFLVKVHGYPDDYFRYTESGLRVLFRQFGTIEVWGWGNRFTLETFHRYGWLSAKNTRRLCRVALWNEEEWPIDFCSWLQK